MPAPWTHIDCHQFRIEARCEALGQPTPEGVHRDGVDYVFVMLVNRVNIESGTTSVHDLDGRLLERPAHRDVLVITLRHRHG